MPNYVDIDNRDAATMNDYHEAAIAALRRALAEVRAENEALKEEGGEGEGGVMRTRPIYGTDFSKPLPQIIEEIRNRLTQIRGELSDVRYEYPGWGERTEEVEGLLSCGISYLYYVREEILKHEAAKKTTA